MSSLTDRKSQVKCAEARKWFRALEECNAPDSIRDRVKAHVAVCRRCNTEYRVSGLENTVLRLGAASELPAADEEFFKALRARLARGPETAAMVAEENSWALLVWLSGRQLVPGLAMLLLLMIGATMLWDGAAPDGVPSPMDRPMDRMILGEEYDYPQPTTDDVLETLVAVEERANGR